MNTNDTDKQVSCASSGNKRLRWAAGAVLLTLMIGLILYRPLPVLFYQDLPFMGFFSRAFYVLLLSFMLCLYRICKGPTAADRIVAIDILGVLIVGFCAILNIATKRSWYLDIGIAWALQSFIASLALAKYLEGRGLDE
ncbi:MAG: cation:proton antiporter [Candidatus Omnitrophota bacterium]